MPVIETIAVPEGLKVEVSLHRIKVSNGKNELQKDFKVARIELKKKNNSIQVTAASTGRKTMAIGNSIAKHIQNMFKGLKKGFEYKLAIVYSHFPMNIVQKGEWLEINNFMGEKKPRKSRLFKNCTVEIKGKEITVRGIDLQAVSQTAANLEKATRVAARDRRVFQDGIYIVKKGDR